MNAPALKLPARVRMDEAAQQWSTLHASLRAEAAQVKSAAGERLELFAGDLQDFDSGALSLLLGAARTCKTEGVQLQIHAAPQALRELARVYGVLELLWPEKVRT